MLVYVLNKHGKPLMPCKPSKARKLLKQGKAKIIQREPFTIQLIYGSSGYKQFNDREPLSISDIYTNLHLNIIATGVNSNDIFNIDTYEKVLNEYGIQINENIKQALIYNLDKALPDPKLTGRL